MISFRDIQLRRGSRILLENLDWTLFRGQHIGLTGANGCGKSSLFSLILGGLSADQGDVEINSNLRIAHLAQEMPQTTQTAREFVIDGDQVLRETERALQQALVEDAGLDIAHAHDALHAMDAWSAPTRAARVLQGLSFTTKEIDLPVSSFSGGWQMRLLLAQALMCPSDLLLLDEPTNHLDLDAVIWLSSWLKNYSGTLLMISHDRDFIDETVQHIAHIEDKKLEVYSGNYSDFEKWRAEQKKLQAAQHKSQQLKIAKLQGFVDRFRAKASKAKQAQSRVKALERMEIIAAVQENAAFSFKFKTPTACPYPLLQLEDVKLAYSDNVVFEHLTFPIDPGDRIALIGPNGAGKSSLIRALAGEMQPNSGERLAGSGLQIGYFAQHHVDHLDANATPLDLLQKISPNVLERERRTWLGSFAFSGDRVKESISTFSGGEKSRLALALIVWQKPNLLLLDEPTNHLDMAMRDALAFALQEFQGAMVLVSHDRFLIRATVDQLVLVAAGKVNEFTGDLSEYESWLSEYRRKTTGVSKAKKKRKKKVCDVYVLEDQMRKLQVAMTVQEEKISDPVLQDFANRDRLTVEVAKGENLQKDLQKAEDAWLAAVENEEKG